MKGSFRRIDVPKPSESLDFPLVLNSSGQTRLLLECWSVENPPQKCSELSKGKEVTSNVFLVRE
jgi:hypothetical protein